MSYLPSGGGGKEIKYYQNYGQQGKTTLTIPCYDGSFWLDHGDISYGGFTIQGGVYKAGRANNGTWSVRYDTTTHTVTFTFRNISGTLYGIYTEP